MSFVKISAVKSVVLFGRMKLISQIRIFVIVFKKLTVKPKLFISFKSS